MVVLAVIGVLAGITLPSLGGFSGAGADVRRASMTLSSAFEMARQYAIAQNTRVYLALTNAPVGEAQSIVIFTARDGNQLFSAAQTALDFAHPGQAENVSILRRWSGLRNVAFDHDRSRVPDPSFAPQLPAEPLDSTYQVRDHQGVTLPHILQFGPTGEVSHVGGDPAAAFEVVVVHPTQPNHARIVRLSGLTGLPHVFVP